METDYILKKIKDIIDTTNSILISGQANPDGDSLGSQLALYAILEQHKQQTEPSGNPDIVISNDEPPPSRYSFLPNFHVIIPYEEIQHRQFDVGFILDSGSDRVGRVLPVLQKCTYTINIDHHKNRVKSQEHIAWVEPEMSSVGEMVYGFLEHPEWNVTLNTDIAACLYAAIIYDTGSFRYPSTSPRTHRIATKLLETGIDFAKIAEHVFLEKPFSAVQLLSVVLQNLQRIPNGEILWGTITQKLLKTVHAMPEVEEGIITQYAFTKGVKVAVLFKELSSTRVKVSFRSRGALDVGKFAQNISTQGGGHQRAAGCILTGEIGDVQEMVIRALQDALRNNFCVNRL
jgi:phosphoesterase RecJ-like protein